MSEPVRLLRSLDRTMPMAFGVLKPSILIPSIADTWTLDRRRAVLLHELAHIAPP
jgi:beta-lactamase regulating signal transducer with metallopeptidase domain